MKLSIVMTYYQREEQLLKTLDSFRQYKYDFDVVVVDDNSPSDIKLPDDIPFEVTVIKVKEKQWINPCVTFNMGFVYALKSNPDIVVIQNAECYHAGDILGYVLKNSNDSNYLSFATYSLGEHETIEKKDFNNRIPVFCGDSAWYNHSRFRPVAYHFCSAITAKNLRKINGFDEGFALGNAYDDDYFIHQIRTLGLKVEIIDNPFVFHQWHYSVNPFHYTNELVNRTYKFYMNLKSEKKYKAQHYITENL